MQLFRHRSGRAKGSGQSKLGLELLFNLLMLSTRLLLSRDQLIKDDARDEPRARWYRQGGKQAYGKGLGRMVRVFNKLDVESQLTRALAPRLVIGSLFT